MEPGERAQCAAMAARLHAQGALAAWGLGMSGLLAAMLLVRPGPAATALWIAGALLGGAERYLALRLRLDASLFDALARGDVASLSVLDGALARVGLRRAPEGLRPLSERLEGTRALVRRHLAVVAGQTALGLLAVSAVLHRSRSGIAQ